jgi:hypothetical protein
MIHQTTSEVELAIQRVDWMTAIRAITFVLVPPGSILLSIIMFGRASNPIHRDQLIWLPIAVAAGSVLATFFFHRVRTRASAYAEIRAAEKDANRLLPEGMREYSRLTRSKYYWLMMQDAGVELVGLLIFAFSGGIHRALIPIAVYYLTSALVWRCFWRRKARQLIGTSLVP